MAGDLIRSSAYPIVRVHGQWQLRRIARRLEQAGSRPATALARTLREAFAPVNGPVERARVDEIERMRAELKRSTDIIDDRIEGTSDGVGPIEQPMPVADLVHASKSPFWGRMLFRLVREWKPRYCIELGTCAGLSAAYQAVGLELNGVGHLTTFEGSSGRVAVARGVFERLALGNVDVVPGLFSDTLRRNLGRESSLGYAFLDGHHDGNATIRYYESLRPSVDDEAIIVLDDIRWSSDMAAAWSDLRCRDEVAASVSLGNVGFLALDVGGSSRVEAEFEVRGTS